MINATTSGRRAHAALLAVWTLLILVASGDTFSAGGTGNAFRTLLGVEIPYVLHILVRKLAHVFFYGVEGFLALRATRRPFAAIAIAFIVAVTDEFHQSTTGTRTGSVFDVALDVIAAAAVMWVAGRRRVSAG